MTTDTVAPTNTANRFTLAADPETLYRFLADHVVDDWNPLEVGGEDSIYSLVHDAHDKGIIAGPADVDLEFEYSADGDGGGFTYLVRINREIDGRRRSLTLASDWREMRNLVSCCGEVTGIDAGAEILQDAVAAGNDALEEFELFTRPAKIQILHVRDPDSECDIAIYLNGAEFTGKSEVEDMDPGRGYEREDYERNLELSREAAAAPDAGQFEADVLGAYEEMGERYRKFSTDDDWDREFSSDDDDFDRED